MTLAAAENLTLLEASTLPSGYVHPHWYAAYTCANHEHRVAEQLAQRSVEQFLPTYETLRHWKDRRVRLHLPLFPSYVFVRILLRERLKVLELPSIVRLVGFNSLPVPLPDGEIESLRQRLSHQVRAEPYPYLTVGRRVRVKAGPLAGFEGILVRKKQKYRIVLSVELIMRSIAAEVDIADVEPTHEGKT